MNPTTTPHDGPTADRLARRREHLMSEITTVRNATEPARQRRIASPRSRFARVLVGCAAVVVLSVGALTINAVVGGPTGHGPAAFAVDKLPTGIVSIRVVDSSVSAKHMTEQLHARGINVTIDAVPVPAQRVGFWVPITPGDGIGGDALARTLANQITGYTATLQIPANLLTTNITLYVGRAERPGEQPAVDGLINAFAPGGLLYCDRLSGTTPRIAAATLTAAGYSVHWQDASAGDTLAQRNQIANSPTPPPGIVVFGALDAPNLTGDTNPKAVYVKVTTADNRAYNYWLWTGYPKAERTSGQRDYTSCPAQ